MATEDQIREALRRVEIADLKQDVVTLGLVKNLKVQSGVVAFTVELPAASMRLKDRLEAEMRSAIAGVPGVRDVAILFTASAAKTGGGHRGVRHVVAVGSGKGGVGKSTVTANLALALAENNARVGILDADIYGPSIPFLMGVSGTRPPVVGDKLQPIVAHGIKLMSMGLLLPKSDEPVVWRGPMLGRAIQQLLDDVEWGDLDYLLVDLPPGTGDVPLSLVQAVPLTGAVIVITPQPVAGAIGVKTLRMLQQSKVPILGLVENMARFKCPGCGTETAIFDQGGGRKTSQAEGIPFLGEIPLDPAIRESGDAGAPVLVTAPDSAQAAAFREVAGNIRRAIAELTAIA